jgi:hypothetical protein
MKKFQSQLLRLCMGAASIVALLVQSGAAHKFH